MKKPNFIRNHFRIFLAVAAFAILSVALTACGLFDMPLQSISFDESYIELFVGQESTVNYRLNPLTASDKVTLTSDDPTIATVDKNGNTKGVKAGSTKFRVKSENGKVSEEIEVSVTYDKLKHASLTADTNKVQYYDKISSATPAGVQLTVAVNQPNDYTNNTYFSYEWFLYRGDNYEITKEEIAAMVTANETDKYIPWTAFESYSEIFRPQKILGEAISMFVRVTENGGETPKAVYTNLVTFGVYNEMSGVTIEVPQDSGLEYDPSSGYTAQVGRPVILTLKWNANCNAAPDIKWLFGEKFSVAGSFTSAAVIEGQISRQLWFIPTSLNAQYEISARADDANSLNTVQFATRKADVADVILTPATADGTVLDKTRLNQQTSSVFPVTFTVDWNKEYAGADKAVRWYVNGAEQIGRTGLTFTVTPTVGVTASYEVYAKVFFNDAPDGTTGFTLSEKLVLRVNEHFDAINSARISAENDDYLQQNLSSFTSFKINLNSAPATTVNPNATAVWYNNGKVISGATCKAFGYIVFTPTAGENNVYAVIDNVRTNTLTIFVVTAQEVIDREAYMRGSYLWNGELKNDWISYPEEVSTVVQYMLVNKIASKSVFFPFSPNFPDGTTMESALDIAVHTFDVGMGAIGCGVTKQGNIFTFNLTPLCIAVPAGPSEPIVPKTDANVPQAPSDVNIDGVPYDDAENARTLFIDSAPLSPAVVTNSNMLFLTVQSGYRPKFDSDANGQKLAALYADARTIALTIMRDDMSDFEKVLAIHDWIVYFVEYDTPTANTNASTDIYVTNNSFYLEGVFNTVNRLAVCDGKSKAFVLLCAMENITALRIAGTANGGGHAWNKVLIDPDTNDDTAIKQWYVVDTTWGDRNGLTSNGSEYEFLTHTYFLVSDEDIAATHTEMSYIKNSTEYVNYPVASNDASSLYYKNKTFTYNNTTYSHYITTDAELDALILSLKAQSTANGGQASFCEIQVNRNSSTIVINQWLRTAATRNGVDVDYLSNVGEADDLPVYIIRIKL
ncbi:MAG: Ig-like domain-containing protein [Clostridiaceae bacterium]|jgi:hypothetical protein|nr:Ig-like domain-containing protein [Clostridiaceae bacterium]